MGGMHKGLSMCHDFEGTPEALQRESLCWCWSEASSAYWYGLVVCKGGRGSDGVRVGITLQGKP